MMLSDKRPLVSILIPCHNAEKWVGEAIESSLSQTYENIEVIVIDDGSSDKSIEVIKSFEDNVTIIQQPNIGSNPTRNKLLEHSNGDWLQYLDADDYLEPDKISTQMALLNSAPHADVIWQSITLQKETSGGPEFVRFEHHREPIDMWELFVRWHTPQTGAFLYRKSAVEGVGGWDPRQPCCQDNALTLALLKARKRFCYSRSYGAVYRDHSNDTLSRRSSGTVFYQRTRLLDEAEIHLQKIGELTRARKISLSQARLEIARSLWPIDKQLANRLFDIVNLQTPSFFGSTPIPTRYIKVASLIGFSGAEWLAAAVRKLAKI